MNASSKYILNVLKSWEAKFPGIHIKYAFEEATCFHVIEVEPEEIHEGSEEFAIEETNLWESFFEKFPNEDILISSPSPCNDMSNLIHETGVMVGSYIDSISIPEMTSLDSLIKLSVDDWDNFVSPVESLKEVRKKNKYTYGFSFEESCAGYNKFALAA